jgi:Rrf2 family protein
MKLTTQCRYGTKAMIELARNYKKGPLKRIDLAKRQGISASYLENILILLKSRKLIRTIRGANGGYSLETAPENITMFEIMSALEDSFEPAHCHEPGEGCSRGTGHCSARKFWLDFHEMQIKTLKATNLQTLLDFENSGTGLDYSI